MTALTKVVSLLLILIATTGSPVWCWSVVHAPLQDPLDQPAQLTHASFAGCSSFVLSSRGTPADMNWLARRLPHMGMVAGQVPAASPIGGLAHILIETREASRGAATTSLIDLHSQLTV